MPSYTIPQLQELLNKQYEALKTNETVREELIVEMKSEIKKLKEDKFNYNVFVEEKKNMVILMEEQKKQNEQLEEENEILKQQIEKLKEKESVVDEVFEGLKKNEKEYIHRNNILQRENEKLKKERDSYELYGDLMDEVCDDVYSKFCCVGQIGEGFHAKQTPPTYKITFDYIEERLKKQKNHDVKFWGFFKMIKSMKEELNDAHDENMDLKEENDKFTKMFDAFPNDMDIYSWDEKREMWRHDEDEVSDEEDEVSDEEDEEFDYGESDDWAWGYGSVQKDNEYVIHISGGGDGVSPNGFEDWVIKKHSPNELEYFIRHGGNIPDKLQKDKIIISSPDGNYVSFANKDIFEIMADRLGETDFEWLLDDEDFLCYEEEE